MSARATVAAVLAAACVLVGAKATAQPQVVVPSGGIEVIAEIQVHGNNATPDAEVLALARVERGAIYTDLLREQVRERLQRSGRFEGVEVRKRFASIDDLTRIALVILVDEHPVRIEPAGAGEGASGVRVVRRRWIASPMVMPILDFEDGYGLTYGAAVAYPGVAGKKSRLSVPLSWGGRKRAAVEFDTEVRTPVVSRLRAGVSLERRTNPAFDEEDHRRRVWGRAERTWHRVRAGTTLAWERVSFGAVQEDWTSAGADVTFDTRIDPTFPRNAVWTQSRWTRWSGALSGPVWRWESDVRGYIGLFGQSVLVTRVERDASDAVLPDYFKPLMGGWSNLRGYAAGAFVGDTRTTGSIELRVPVSSPMSVARAGISIFLDGGKIYARGTRFDEAPWRRGAGVSLWLTATIVQAGLSIARGSDGDTRVNLGLGVTF